MTVEQATNDHSEKLATRGQIVSWTLFDFANTAYSVIVVTVIYNRYFTNHVAGGRQWLWGLAVSISMICAAALSPPLGAIADFSRGRKRFLFYFTLASVVCTALLFFVREGMVLLGLLLFVIANIGFEGGLVFYDAFLPRITSKKTYGRVSGYGFAMGYLGALAVLVIVNFMLPPTTDPDYLLYVRLSFVVAAAFFMLFSLPMFIGVPEPEGTNAPLSSFIRNGISQSKRTFQALFIRREYPSIARFLVAFFIYNDGILTVIVFAGIFAEKILNMNDKDIIFFFATVQTSAILGSVVFGVITDKIGPKKTITITLVLWILVCCAAFFIRSLTMFYFVAFGAGIAMAASQSASRSLMALLTPREHEAEFFGFYDGLCGKASAVIGPLVYGIVSDLTDERIAILFIAVFFVAGLVLLQGVVEPRRKPDVIPVLSTAERP
ncbi:MAG TPA: MFS transporter [Bacteroidota bacterium]